jgi:hypothetical protein
LAVEELPPRPTKTKSSPKFSIVTEELKDVHTIVAGRAEPPATQPVSSDATRVIDVFRALGYVLSARALLFLAICGGFILAMIAALHETQAALYVLVAWCCLTIGPIIALEFKRRAD